MDEIKTPDYADFKVWALSLQLKIDDINADINYAEATSFCSDCPKRLDEDRGDDWLDFRSDCCKETGEWEQQYDSDFEYLRKLSAAKAAVLALIPEGE